MNSKFVMCFALLVALSGCSLLGPRVRKISFEERRHNFPKSLPGLSGPIELRWNQHAVPYVFAPSDADAFVALGALHAHLRWGQLELLRRVSQGRISESAGPFTRDIDHALRLLNLRASAEKVLAALPPETLAALKSFCDGINAVVKSSQNIPTEFSFLNWSREPFTVLDLLTIGRLASADVNWFVLFRGLADAGTEGFEERWKIFSKLQSQSTATQTTQKKSARLFLETLQSFNRWGSNSWALSAKRTKSGGTILANDPHLGITQPPIWILAGVHTPQRKVVGFMIPGLPFFALGRNPHLAWGGTNMRSLSTSLVRLSEKDKSAITNRTETIRVRLWPDRTVSIRESAYGPLITDLPFFESSKAGEIAMRWVGHQASDEITSFLRANTAKNSKELREAFRGYAVSGQNITWADTAGNIGMFAAVRVPKRDASLAGTLFVESEDPRENWNKMLGVMELPRVENPRSGQLVSANNRPFEVGPPVGFFFSPSDRVEELGEELRKKERWSVEDTRVLQTNVRSRSSRMFAEGVCADLPTDQKSSLGFCDWDGAYNKESTAALDFHFFFVSMANLLVKDAHPQDKVLQDWLLGTDHLKSWCLDRWKVMAQEQRLQFIERAKNEHQAKRQKYATWGDFHRLSVGHPLSNVPVIGDRYLSFEGPTDGGSETPYKSAHGLELEKHNTRYGTNSRHISDLSDLDANYFVLLGGNDGALGSENSADQIPLFLAGELLQMPLRETKIRELFPIRQKIVPEMTQNHWAR